MRFIPREFLHSQNLTGLQANETGAYLLLWYFNSHVNSFANRNPYWLSSGFVSAQGDQVLWSEHHCPRSPQADHGLRRTGPCYVALPLALFSLFRSRAPFVEHSRQLVNCALLVDCLARIPCLR